MQRDAAADTGPVFASGNGGATVSEIAALRSDPRFKQAVRASAAGLIEMYQRHRIMNRVLNDRGHVVIGWMALYLHFHGGPGESPGLTVGRVKALCAETGVCSPGRAAATLALMRFARYLAPAATAADRRLRILVPTERMIDAHRERWAALLDAIAPLVPHAAEARAKLDETEFVGAFVRHAGAMFQAGFRVDFHTPELGPYLERSAGLLVLCNLYLASKATPGRPVTISISDTARRFLVSRAHVRSLIEAAAGDRFVEHRSGGLNNLVVLPRLVDGLETLSGGVFVFLSLVSRAALGEMARRERNAVSGPALFHPASQAVAATRGGAERPAG
ncbi:MAG TPA: hypothetical protein VJ779_11260 [Acetobacteraceae bacterium]|nr:hypothetical protein [Acetobacteraceae bacterium]